MDLIRKIRKVFRKQSGTTENTARKGTEGKKHYKNVRFEENYKKDKEDAFENVCNNVAWPKARIITNMSNTNEEKCNEENLREIPCVQHYDLEFPQKSFPEVVEEITKMYANDLAIKYCEQQITFKELNESVNKLARAFYLYLHNSGSLSHFTQCPIKSGNRTCVALLMPNSIKLITTLFALWKLGICITLIDLSYTKQQMQLLITETQCKMVIWDRKPCFRKLLELNLPGVLLVNCSDLLLESEIQDLPVNELHPFEQVDISCDTVLLNAYTPEGWTTMDRKRNLTWNEVYQRLCWQWRTFPRNKVVLVTCFVNQRLLLVLLFKILNKVYLI